MNEKALEAGVDEPPLRIGVLVQTSADGVQADDARTELHRLPTTGQERLLRALEGAFAVRFERLPAGSEGLNGLLVVGQGPFEGSERLPQLVLPMAPDGHRRTGRVSSQTDLPSDSNVGPVHLADSCHIARPLRGQAIHESNVPARMPSEGNRGIALARLDDRPVWLQLGDGEPKTDLSAYPLAELDEGETLREQLRAGSFMGLLPLVHFIQRLLADRGWQAPPLRASFVIDDPNLHWRSYGFVNYQQLAAHATRHGYHVGFATVPLDGWFVEPRAASLLARNSETLSLMVHGNDHVARELGRLEGEAEAVRTIAQGLRRISALERRSGLTVDRVVVPPHEACSQEALRAAFRLGLEAACITRPHPWLDDEPAATPLTGWRPAELVAGGLPVLPRHPLSATREDLPLRALLGQPLILYGHHGDFADGLEVLEEAAKDIHALGDARWGPLSWIARQSFACRRAGETLYVRMHARRISVPIPAGVHTLHVAIDEPFGGAGGHRLVYKDGSTRVIFEEAIGRSKPIAANGSARMDIALEADRPLRAEDIPRSPAKPWPLIRRALVEARDRAQALR